MIFITVILATAAVLLSLKLYIMKKSLRETSEFLAERIGQDTNQLSVSLSRDRELRRLTAEINRLLRELRSQQLLTQSGDLEVKNAITNISHDLRTPLCAISGYLELLRGEELTPDAARYAEIIAGRVDSLKQLTDELFGYSGAVEKRQMSLSRVGLRGALEVSIAAFYAALSERGIEPEISLPEHEIWRILDGGMLSRILSNLIGNALKYSDGDLSVELCDDGTISFSNRAAKLDNVRLERLFDRFYTVETAGRSTGLGLSIARILTERMGGRISAELSDSRLTIKLVFPETRSE
ncbi:MAG TPA: HAMP domain-containing histidine kinase [Firmicutes bacterium]|nr:HAMP domain-containing histidine kinase [Bacillota bacterium]